jgi:hypothetical protein
MRRPWTADAANLEGDSIFDTDGSFSADGRGPLTGVDCASLPAVQ